MDSSSGVENVAAVNFFDNKETKMAEKRKDFDECFNPIKRMREAEYSDEQKKSFAANGGIPQPYRTPPTWPVADANINVSYKDSIQKSQVPSQGPSPMQTPNPNGPHHMPHAHQLPPHLQGYPTPSQRPPHMHPPQQQHQHQMQQGFDPRMHQHFGGPNGSVQSSPRFPQAQMAAYPQQMQGMPIPQFAGQMAQGYPGMSPSMQYRHVQMPPPGQQGMMMMGQQGHGQSEFQHAYPLVVKL